MPESNNVITWKKKSRIDYYSLFISIWLSLNAWLIEKYKASKDDRDRELIELLKSGGNELSEIFNGLLNGQDNLSDSFINYFSELYSALKNANITYGKVPQKLKKKMDQKKVSDIISFENIILDWRKGNPTLENINEKNVLEEGTIEISSQFHIHSDTLRAFQAYIEIIYQIRCLLIHGALPMNKENLRVVRALYLTLSTIMERV